MTKEYLNTTLQIKAMGEPQKEDSGEFAYFEGYAAAFGNVDAYGDIIKKGAFAESIKSGAKVKMLWQHDSWNPIGSYTELSEDDYGLFVKGRINLGTEQGKQAYALLKAGDLDSMSIGYITRKAYWDEKEEIRTLEEVDLVEVSVVTRPANQNAIVTAVKSMLEEVKSLADIESILKMRGFSNKEAKTFISKFKQISEKRDASEEKPSQRDVDEQSTSELLKSITDLSELIKGKTKNA